MLRVARRLGALRPVAVRTTFLGAHALPPEFDERADAYVDLIVRRDAAAGRGRASRRRGRRVLRDNRLHARADAARVRGGAQALGLPVKLHAEQLSNQGGAALAAEFGALSADHLE